MLLSCKKILPFQKRISLNSPGTRPFGMFRVRQKIYLCRMLIFNVHKSINIMNFVVGFCSKARPRNFRPETLLLVLHYLVSNTTQTNCKTVLHTCITFCIISPPFSINETLMDHVSKSSETGRLAFLINFV